MSYTKRTVVDVHVVDVQKRKQPTKHYVYVINVNWSEGTKFSIYRTYSMLIEFQAKLQDLHQNQVPALPGRFVFGRGSALAEKRRDGVSEFCKQLLRLSSDVTQCDDFLMFFEAWPEDVTIQFDFESNLQSNSFYVSADSSKRPPGAAGEGAVGDETDEVEPYRAVSTWKARSPREISFVSGDRIEVIEKNLNGWWVIVCGNREGVAPASYLEPLNHRPEEDKAEDDPYKGVYVVSIDFRARNYDEISLEVNTPVDVLETTLDGWWRVRAHGKEGMFPSTFLKKMAINKQAKPGAKGGHTTGFQETEGEATYAVLVNPPPRREEIKDVDSIYSSIQSLKRDAKARSTSDHAGRGQKTSRGTADDEDNSDSDIFEYADFAPTGGGGGGGGGLQDNGPEYSEINLGAPTEVALQRKKIQEKLGIIHERKDSDSDRSAQKPEHKPQRLARAKATRRPPPADQPGTMPQPGPDKRTQFSDERTLSQDSVGSMVGTGTREDDIDLYQLKSAYTAEEDVLTLQQGDIVEVDDLADGWAYVRLLRRDNKKVGYGESVEGWAPATFLQLCPKRKPKPNRPPPTLPGESPPQLHQSPVHHPPNHRKVPRADSGPAIVHQTSKHHKVHATQSLNDDIIPISVATTAATSPGVYVNTRPYVNFPSGPDGEVEYATTSSETRGHPTHATSPSAPSPTYNPTDGAGGTYPSPPEAVSPSSTGSGANSREYVNTGPKGVAAETPRSYVNLTTGESGTAAATTATSTPDDSSESSLGATYIALCDYNTMAHNCLSFKQGDSAILLQVKGQGWWKVKCGTHVGWVPASYWEKEIMLPSVSTGSGHTSRSLTSTSSQSSGSSLRQAQTSSSGSSGRRGGPEKSFLDLPAPSGRASPSGRSPSPIRRSPSSSSVNPQVLLQIQKNISGQAWFHGKISRKDAEEAMTRDGNNGDFIIRESTNRVGDFALTVVYNGRVRHFPIEVTMDAKVLIGKHRFESMNKIIQHYKECPLFIQEGFHISLGMPFKKRK